MNARLVLLAVTVALFAGCGRAKGPQPGQTYFWKVTKSDLEFGQCSDDATFRMGLTAIEITADSYFVYKVSSDGKTAVSQQCTALDPRTCTTPENPVTFSITGSELTFSQDRADLIENTACKLAQSETWTFQDKDLTFSLEISDVLTLTDSTTDCDKVENSLKAKSPNMLGVVGCVMTYKLSGDFK